MRDSEGFTIVEVLVAVIISVLLIIGIYSAVSGSLRISVGNTQRNSASNLAYANLRNFANGRDATWWPAGACTTGSTVQLMNSTVSVPNIPSPVTQTVTASVPYGCNSPTNIAVYKLESVVTYGPKNIEVRHATFTMP